MEKVNQGLVIHFSFFDLISDRIGDILESSGLYEQGPDAKDYKIMWRNFLLLINWVPRSPSSETETKLAKFYLLSQRQKTHLPFSKIIAAMEVKLSTIGGERRDAL